MDFTKLEGILTAIESETRLPSPSHNNLARLVAMAFRELMYQASRPLVIPQSPPPGSPITIQLLSKDQSE